MGRQGVSVMFPFSEIVLLESRSGWLVFIQSQRCNAIFLMH